MLENLGIRGKLISAFVAAAMIPAAVVGVSYIYSEKVIRSYSFIADVNLTNMEQIVYFARARFLSSEPILSLVGTESTAADAASAKQKVDNAYKVFEMAAKAYEETEFALGEEELWKELKPTVLSYFELCQEMVRLSGTGKRSDQKLRDQLAGTKFSEALHQLTEVNNKLIAFQKNTSANKKKEAESAFAQMKSIMLLTLVLGVLICIALGYFISNYLGKHLTAVANNLSSAAESVASAASQIASTSEELSQSSTEQAASLEETAASVEEMNSMIAKNTESATKASELSQRSTETSGHGQKIVEKMSQAMGNIKDTNATIMTQISESNQKIAGIVKVVEQIAKKTQVINEIVNKTELLSFNASVEAARAGEHGKGFAVVAEEVGNLARMSGAAAEEISGLIEGSIENVNTVVQETSTKVSELMEHGRKVVDEGTTVASECGDALSEIVSNVRSVTSMAEEIATASAEQARGINEISKAMAQLDQVAQQNAAGSEEAASAAAQLSDQSESLQNSVATLIQIVNGSKAPNLRPTNPIGAAASEKPIRKMESNSRAKVLKLSAPRASSQKRSVMLKKASGDAPSFDDEGFNDV